MLWHSRQRVLATSGLARYIDLPSGVLLTGRGDDWLRFRVDSPDVTNPVLLQLLISSHLRVVSFQPVQRSLEAAYLKAVGRAAAEEDHVRTN